MFLGGGILEKVVSCVVQFNILHCSGLRMIGERKNRDREGGRHQLLTTVAESGPIASSSLESVCILAAVGISNYSRDYFKIGLA